MTTFIPHLISQHPRGPDVDGLRVPHEVLVLVRHLLGRVVEDFGRHELEGPQAGDGALGLLIDSQAKIGELRWRDVFTRFGLEGFGRVFGGEKG